MIRRVATEELSKKVRRSPEGVKEPDRFGRLVPQGKRVRSEEGKLSVTTSLPLERLWETKRVRNQIGHGPGKKREWRGDKHRGKFRV